MKIWEKFSNIIKKINSELIFNKKYVKAEKKFNTQKKLSMFLYTSNMIDSVYRKDENYYPKVILEKFIHIFLEKYKKVWFLGSS